MGWDPEPAGPRGTSTARGEGWLRHEATRRGEHLGGKNGAGGGCGGKWPGSPSTQPCIGVISQKINQTKPKQPPINEQICLFMLIYLFIYFLFVYCPHFLAANFPLHHESTCRRAEHICCYLFIFFPFLGPKTKLTRPSCFQSGSRLLGLFCGFFFLPYFPQIELYFHLCHGKGRHVLRRTHLPCSGCHSMWFKELELGQCLPRASPAGTAPSSLPLPLCCPRAISRPLLEAFGALLAELPLAR